MLRIIYPRYETFAKLTFFYQTTKSLLKKRTIFGNVGNFYYFCRVNNIRASPAQNMSLSIKDLSIGYGARVVQQGLNLKAESGNLVCLIGTNGCGKSTLLRTLAGLQPSLAGSILLGDTELTELGEKERSKQISVVLTDRLSADRTTVYDIVAMGRYPYTSMLGRLTEDDRHIVEEALCQTEMLQKQHRFFNELSDGEKQRTLIAKALTQQTPLVLLDEPTAHLDLPNRIKTLLMLRQLAHSSGRIVIISTHELNLALQTADYIWLMVPDRGIEVGTPEALVESGEFQKAFEDKHFRFISDAGTLRLLITDN